MKHYFSIVILMTYLNSCSTTEKQYRDIDYTQNANDISNQILSSPWEKTEIAESMSVLPVITLTEEHRVDIQDKKRFNPLRLLFHFRNEHQTRITFTDHYLLRINTTEEAKTEFPIRRTLIQHGEQIPSTPQYTFSLRIHLNGTTSNPTDIYACQGTSIPDNVNLPALKAGDMVEYVIKYQEKTNDIATTLLVPAHDLYPTAHYTYEARIGKKLRSRIITPEDMNPQVEEANHQFIFHLSRENITTIDTCQNIKMQVFNVFESQFIGIHLKRGMSVNHQLIDMLHKHHPYGLMHHRKKGYHDLITPLESLLKGYNIKLPELHIDPHLTPGEKAKKIALYCRDLTDVEALPKHKELDLLVGLLKEHNIAYQLAYTSHDPEKELEDADYNGQLWFVRIDHDGTCLFPYIPNPYKGRRLPVKFIYVSHFQYGRADQVPSEYVGKRAVTEDFRHYFIIEPNK